MLALTTTDHYDCISGLVTRYQVFEAFDELGASLWRHVENSQGILTKARAS